jgi:hypothetical protein
MKKKITCFLKMLPLMTLCLVSVRGGAQTGLKVIGWDGSEQLFTITETGNMHFDPDHLIINEEDETISGTIPFTAIRKIVFVPLGTAIPNNTVNKPRFSVYPNPVKDCISIANAEGKQKVKIYSAGGQICLSGEFMPEEKINLNELPPGFYLIQVNGETLKFSKQ